MTTYFLNGGWMTANNVIARVLGLLVIVLAARRLRPEVAMPPVSAVFGNWFCSRVEACCAVVSKLAGVVWGEEVQGGCRWSHSGRWITSRMIMAFHDAGKSERRRWRQVPNSYVHGPVTNRRERAGMPL